MQALLLVLNALQVLGRLLVQALAINVGLEHGLLLDLVVARIVQLDKRRLPVLPHVHNVLPELMLFLEMACVLHVLVALIHLQELVVVLIV